MLALPPQAVYRHHVNSLPTFQKYAALAWRFASSPILWSVVLAVGWARFLSDPIRDDPPAADPVEAVVYFVWILQWTWLAVFVGRTSRQPLWRVFVTLTNAFLFLVLGFSYAYWAIGEAANFAGGPLSKLDAIYFTLGTLTTAGTGTISAIGALSRATASLQMVLDIALTGFALAFAVARLTEKMDASDPQRSEQS
jgi:hypothetical protein